VLAANAGLARRPLKLTLALTERCSFACQTCHIWENPEPAEPGIAGLGRFFDRNRHFSWIDLTGGEIFERRDLDEVIGLITLNCRRLYLLHFPTNGWWPERVEKTVKKARRRSEARLIVTVSIDGPPVLHNDLRGRADSFRRAVETLDRLRRLPGVQVFAGMTLGPRNVSALEATLRAIARVIPGFGPEELHVNFLNRSGHYFRNTDCDAVEAAALLTAVAGLKARRGMPLTPELLIEHLYLSLIPRFTATGKTPLFCQSLTGNCFLAADWTLYPCTIWDKPLLNLREYEFDLERAWRTEKVNQCRSQISRKECPNCWTPCEAYPSILGMGRSLIPFS